MSTGEIIFLTIGAAIAGFGIWHFLPKSMFFINPGSVTSWFVAGQEISPAKMEKAKELLEQLNALGFTPSGVLFEKPPLWAKALEVLILTSDTAGEFICVVIGKRRMTYYFQTLYTGGQVIITADGGFKPVNEGGLYQSIVSSDNPAEILERHRENVKHFVSQGFSPVHAYTGDVIGGSTQVYYGFPIVQKGMRTYGSMNSGLLFILCIPLILALA
ncbi:MAG: hypothetical protein MUO19_08860 [Dehalococcoidales bacterium]|nr:hypothetical protein [Dehalococcoidales bacterium]